MCDAAASVIRCSPKRSYNTSEVRGGLMNLRPRQHSRPLSSDCVCSVWICVWLWPCKMMAQRAFPPRAP